MNFKVLAPEEVIFELTVCFTLAQWLKVREALQASPVSSFPANDLVDAIRMMTAQARESFYPKAKDAKK